MILEAARNRLQMKFDQIRGKVPVQVEITPDGLAVVASETYTFPPDADFAELLLELGEIDVHADVEVRLQEAWEILSNFESE